MRVFKEQQRFTQSWIIILVILGMMVPFGIIIKEYNKENSDMSLNELILVLSFIFLFSFLIFLFRLKTRIDEKGIYYQFFPFHFSYKIIHWSEIKEAYVRTYEPIGEYGGWGLKGGWSSSKGKAINVSGTLGIQLILTNEKKLLIGTQKEDNAKRIIAYYHPKINKK